MKIQITDKFRQANKIEIPYEHDSQYWHVWLDICSVTAKDNNEIDLIKMIKVHGTDFKYYENSLPVLEQDGYLKIKHDKRDE